MESALKSKLDQFKLLFQDQNRFQYLLHIMFTHADIDSKFVGSN